MIKVKTAQNSRISQGDIYRNVEFIEYAIEKEGMIEISKINFPFVVVLTQDCDLDQDYKVRWSRSKKANQDKKLFSVIVAPLYNYEHFIEGEHLSILEMDMRNISKEGGDTTKNNLKQNQTPRYHFLEFPESIPIVSSVIDFKHYFTVNVEYLKKHKTQYFVCQISQIYREALSQRFSNYLARIALP